MERFELFGQAEELLVIRDDLFALQLLLRFFNLFFQHGDLFFGAF